jgi:large subunit ribosomal protein L18
MVIRKSNRAITVQFIEFDPRGDMVIFGVNSHLLKKMFNWPAKRNTWTAYLTGLYAGVGAKKKGIKRFVADIGMHSPTKGSIVFAAIKGAVDAGLETSYNEEKVPVEKLKNVPESLKQAFDDVKNRILSEGV